MNYKDVVLRLLNSRKNIICMEQHLISDFSDDENRNHSFLEWCENNNISCMRITSKDPARLVLTKRGN